MQKKINQYGLCLVSFKTNTNAKWCLAFSQFIIYSTLSLCRLVLLRWWNKKSKVVFSQVRWIFAICRSSPRSRIHLWSMVNFQNLLYVTVLKIQD